ncbi:MAG: DDE-type integrase/transposase/recombinase [Acetobacteraceae bacterium]|nr:DDE-type integrase/transposase/recombinase [Acetobacteraceae bacterium]
MSVPANYTPRVSLPSDQVVRFDGRLLNYKGRADDAQRQHVFLGRDGVPMSMTDAELLAVARKGELVLVSEEQVALEEGRRNTPPPCLALASDEDLAEARRKEEYCREWRRAGRPARSSIYLAAIAAAVAARRGEEPPPPRTYMRWLSHWVAAGEHIDGLLPDRGGNHKDRLEGDARDLLRNTVHKYYLVDVRPTGCEVYRAVQTAFEKHNEVLPEEDQLPVPSLKAVYRQIDEVDRYTLEYCRFGPRRANHRFRPVGDGPLVERHNQAWEVDHTTVDAIAIDAVTGMPIGRPIVTVILDRLSRMVMGFRIGWERPSAAVVLDCMAVAIEAKEDLLARYPEIRGPWPCFGLPQLIVTDQGREFKSRSFIEACLSFGIDVEYTPILKAWYKGRVERFFGTLTRSVFQRVPGTTFSDIFLRNGEHIPETVAMLTLPELYELTLRWIVSIYHRRPHRALGGRSPLDIWTESVGRHGIALPPGKEEIVSKLASTTFRKPQRYGIEVEGLIYNSAEVAGLRVRPDAPRDVKVHVDRSDLTRIWFTDPADGERVEVPILRSMHGLVQGITLEKHQMARAMQRQNPELLAGEAGLRRAYRALDEGLRRYQQQDGLLNRQRAAAAWEKFNRIRTFEDAPAFDIEGSAEAVIDPELGDDVEVAPAPAADPQPEAAPRPARKPNAAPLAITDAAKDAEAAAEARVEALMSDEDDPDALIAELGMRITETTKEDDR